MTFFNLEVLIGKPTKSKGIMPYLKFSKAYAFGTKKLNFFKKNSYELMKIWPNF
jgi:hypothetical protein